MIRKGRRQPGGLRAVVFAVLVHLAVIGIVVVGFQYTATPTAPVAQPIQAKLVEDPRKLEAERKRQEGARRKAEEQRRKEEEARRRAEEQKRLAERKRRDEEARKKAEAERKRQAELERQEQERKKAEAERQEAERRKKEQETRRKAAEESLREQLALEEQARIEQELVRRAEGEKARYIPLIQQKVSRNWAEPVGVPEGLKCTVRVRLLPGGDVVEATVTGASGNAVFDRSVEVAVRKASPLPIPADPDLFPQFREINFVFDPSRVKG